MSNILCPFCNHKLDEEIYNGIYGCDTGCEIVRIDIECPNCNKVTWSSQEFGEFDDEEEKQRYHESFMEEFAKELELVAKIGLKR